MRLDEAMDEVLSEVVWLVTAKTLEKPDASECNQPGCETDEDDGFDCHNLPFEVV